MGTRGTRRNISSSQPRDDEPALLTSVESFIKEGHKHGLYKGDNLDMFGLIGIIPDIKIEYIPLGSSISGSLSRKGNNWIIMVNSLHHPNRQKFTLAHELAHYVLHKNESDIFTDTVFFRGGINNSIEKTANQFASELLMPQKRVNDLIVNENIRSVSELAARFGVSSSAMLYRVKDLGYKTKE